MTKNFTIGAFLLFMIITIFLFSYGTHGTKSYDPDIINTATTTNATPSNLVTIALATGQTMRVVVDIIAISGNNRMRGRKTAAIKNISGTLSIVGATVTDIVPPIGDVALAAAGFDISISGTNVIVPVTGITATTINWVANTTFIIN